MYMKFDKDTKILYGQTVEVCISDRWHTGVINGKVAGIDAYVIDITGEYVRLPNRHLKLDWGHFSGKDKETIVFREEIAKVLK